MEIEGLTEGGDRLVCVKEAAAKLSVSVRTVWRMISDGQLEAVRFRRCTRLSLAQISKYLQSGGRLNEI